MSDIERRLALRVQRLEAEVAQLERDLTAARTVLAASEQERDVLVAVVWVAEAWYQTEQVAWSMDTTRHSPEAIDAALRATTIRRDALLEVLARRVPELKGAARPAPPAAE